MLATTMTGSERSHDDIFVVVRGVVLALDIPELKLDAVLLESRLVEDLGLDSLRFVDLTVGLEEVFGFEEFPMQEWVDDLIARGEGLTIGALVEACRQLRERAES